MMDQVTAEQAEPVRGPRATAHEGTPQLRRGLGIVSMLSIGVATVAPVVGLYSIFSLGMVTAGPWWIWPLLISLGCQLLVAVVYAGLARRIPITGGPFQWARRLVGPKYAWFTGVMYLIAVSAALTTVAYLAAPWMSNLFFGVTVTGPAALLWSAGLLLLGLLINCQGLRVTKAVINIGILCEVLASIALGIVLLLAFQHQPWEVFAWESSQVIVGQPLELIPAAMTALAVCGWAFVGFDASASVVEEAHGSGATAAKAIVGATALVGGIVLMVAVAVILATRDLPALTRGEVADPVLDAVTSNLGPMAEKPFLLLVAITFFACVLSMQTYLGRVYFAIAREDALPAKLRLAQVSARTGIPVRAISAATVVALCGLLLGLSDGAMGTMIRFGTGGLYIVFTLVVAAVVFAQVSGRWAPWRIGTKWQERWFSVISGAALLWLGCETINIAWPRPELAAPGASPAEVWSVVWVFGGFAIIALLALLIARPHARLRRLER
ncbi:APC family permease [Leucobacter luti]|uniref:APC family permease n=1 Tax=Leucobacter luti TaxID=340320 RepID=UPI001C6889C1|nr:APC family permease [Leucobacter luti]QYM75025.1 APC family permease [Leucobacter luti]